MKKVYLSLKKSFEPTREIKIYTGHEQARLRDLINKRQYLLSQAEALMEQIEDIVYEAQAITIVEDESRGEITDDFTNGIGF